MPRKKIKSPKPSRSSPKPSRPSSKPKRRSSKPGEPSSILATLSVGAWIEINQAGSSNRMVFVVFISLPGGEQGLIAAGPPVPGAGTSTFVITAYAFNGSNEAKISLQPQGMEGSYWVAGQNVASLEFPILLGPNPGQFLLTDLGGGDLTIQNTFSPPGTYVRAMRSSTAGILTYGYDTPLLQGAFNIQVVG